MIKRAKQGFGSGLNKVYYSQSKLVSGYRADCSGFVCRALGLTSAVGNGWWGGLNTVTLVTSGALKRIGINDLKPGDLCGELGPGTAGDGGHVYVFDKWYNQDPNDNRMWIYEQCGGTYGPIHTVRTWPYPGTCAAYRYVGITETETEASDLPTVKQIWNTDNLIKAPSTHKPTNKNDEYWWPQTFIRSTWDHAHGANAKLDTVKSNQARDTAKLDAIKKAVESVQTPAVDSTAVAKALAENEVFVKNLAAALASHVKVA